MPASYPKPDAERRNRVAPAFGWTHLAPRPRVKAPPLPAGDWSDATLAWWTDLWTSPQAVMWDATGRTLLGAAHLVEFRARNGTTSAVEAELRQHYDRHGLNPKAMLQLRWRIGDPGDLDGVAAEPVPAAAPRRRPDEARRRRLLRSLDEPA